MTETIAAMSGLRWLVLMAHNTSVTKTNVTGFGDLCRLRRMNRRLLAVFHLSAMSPMGGNGGDTFGYAGTRNRRFANPAICRPPSFGDDAGGSPDYGAYDMAALPILARSAPVTYPQSEKAARHAVRVWFAGAPTLSLAQWREKAREAHLSGLPVNPKRDEAFDRSFAAELAQMIGGAFHG